MTNPIFKKGDKNKPENYRGITLLNSTLKLLTKIESYVEMNEEQCFRSTTDTIFILRQITKKANEYNSPAFMCLVDVQKAFDRIQLDDVVNILKEDNVLNKNTTTKIQSGNQTTAEIK